DLLSANFLDAQNHPTAEITLTSTNKASFKVEATADVTLRGQTNSESFNVSVSGSGEDGLLIGGSLVFDRTDYGINYGSGSIFDDLGDNVIQDQVAIAFNIKATKVAAE
ncbi:MAG: YceI family protein, partial [Flavobacteriales bacterium]|nr:YceI family protein [Flavobacteriales bacterium]